MLFTHWLVINFLIKVLFMLSFTCVVFWVFFFFILNMQTQFTVHFAKLIDLSNLPILSAFQYVHTFFCNLITDVHFFSSKPPYFLSISPGYRVNFLVKISLRMQITIKTKIFMIQRLQFFQRMDDFTTGTYKLTKLASFWNSPRAERYPFELR